MNALADAIVAALIEAGEASDRWRLVFASRVLSSMRERRLLGLTGRGGPETVWWHQVMVWREEGSL